MASVILEGEFDLDFSKAEQNSLCRNGAQVAEFVAGCVEVKTGGFIIGSGPVKESDESGRPVAKPGRFYISVGVPQILAKFYEISPQIAINEMFSSEAQEEYGISNITLNFHEFSTSKARK